MAGDATSGLLLALFSTFFVIFCGYALRSLKILAPSAQQTLGSLVLRVVLPAMVFLAMATLNLNAVSWMFLLGMALSKVIICVGVVAITLLAERGAPMGIARAGIYGIFTTQSNDFALGLPILQTMYPPDLLAYIYLVGPISFFIINPAMFGMLELGTFKAGTRTANNRFGMAITIIIVVLRNPVVAATLLGMIVNLCTDGFLPLVVKSPLTILSSSFAAFALLALGAAMYGKLGTLKGVKLLRALLLISAKTIVLPVMTSVILGMLGQTNYQSLNGQNYDISLFGFLMGGFPTAPNVFSFALDYGVDPEEIGAASVLCTLLAAPLMFISAKMAVLQIDENNNSQYTAVVFNAGVDLSYISLVGSVLVVGLYMWYKCWRKNLDCHVICLAIICFCFAITEKTCDAHIAPGVSGARFTVAWYFFFAIRTWTSLLALCLLGELLDSKWIKGFCSGPSYMLGVLLPTFFVAMVWTTYSQPLADKEMECWFETKQTGLELDSVILFLTLAVTAVAAIFLIRSKRITPQEAESLMEADAAEQAAANVDLDASVAKLEQDTAMMTVPLASNPMQDLASPESREAALEALKAPHVRGGGHSPDNDDDYDDDDDDDIVGSGLDSPPAEMETSAMSTEQVNGGPASVTELSLADPAEKETVPPPSNLAYFIFICMAILSTIVGLFNSLWVLTSNKHTGIYIEVLFLDWVMIHSQGTLLFFCVGTRSKLWEPLIKMLKKIFRKLRHPHGLEENMRSQDVDLTMLCSPRIIVGLDSAFNALCKLRTFRMKKYGNALDGSELVSFMVVTGIKGNRDESVTIGKALVTCGVLTSVTKEHHFHDEAYFYKLDRQRWTLVRTTCLGLCGMGPSQHLTPSEDDDTPRAEVSVQVSGNRRH